MIKAFLLFFRSIIFLFVIHSLLQAESLRDSVEKTLNSNPKIIAEHFNKKAFRINIEEEQGDYLPTLDFSTYYESSHTYDDREESQKTDSFDAGKTDAGKNGWNAAFEFEHVLYDGGMTPNQIEEFRHRYNNIRYTSRDVVEDLILNVVNNYLDLISYQEQMALDNLKIKTHEGYLVLAKEKEELSGEKLDYIQVQSKISAIMDNYLAQEVSQQKAISAHQRLTGERLKGNICRPILDESKIPKNVEDAIEIALRKNNQIKAQEELIREQTARYNGEFSKLMPVVRLQLAAELDNDLKIPENGQRDIYRARIQSSWNLFNGGKDSLAIQREKIYILQQKQILKSIKDEVIDNMKGSYETFYRIKKRIKNMEKFIGENTEIVDIYYLQLQDGSRTFLDLLNAEAELFRTKILMIETQISLYKEYYTILKALNMLSDTILLEKGQTCGEYILKDELYLEREKAKEEENIDELSDELGLD